jgi:hypothetical protein
MKNRQALAGSSMLVMNFGSSPHLMQRGGFGLSALRPGMGKSAYHGVPSDLGDAC